MAAVNPFPDGFCPAGVCPLYGCGPEKPGVSHAIEHLTKDTASWSFRRKHGLVQVKLGFLFLDRLRLDRKVSLLRSFRSEAEPVFDPGSATARLLPACREAVQEGSRGRCQVRCPKAPFLHGKLQPFASDARLLSCILCGSVVMDSYTFERMRAKPSTKKAKCEQACAHGQPCSCDPTPHPYYYGKGPECPEEHPSVPEANPKDGPCRRCGRTALGQGVNVGAQGLCPGCRAANPARPKERGG